MHTRHFLDPKTDVVFGYDEDQPALIQNAIDMGYVELEDAQSFLEERNRKIEEAYLAAMPYSEKRASEYPSFLDYLDGVVKNDQTQIQEYIDACLAVKAKYPKP